MKPGDRVKVRLDNGYTDTGTIVRCFKNGRYGVREDRRGDYYIRGHGRGTVKLLGPLPAKTESEAT